ncbi:S-adenosyl-L-methionine-dependent methyltransferase [Coniochaeta ligniaria NRRL 30616]|uniref:S-adenosyl-L-methionine-dependent methyltransferase n=1 Tax=Coniochaeta ligniaria NRRL 30616 TaxID=1408157 RepID=A0A1J7IDP6_9PEZI|nr:S-adenosyl-L-methionine-dependent methyltransferase [Coniochaeta ligniaria NRRL 30616]
MTTPPPVPEGSKAKVTLTGTPATLLLSLTARVQDCHSPDPILNDKWAEYVADQIDYDYSAMGVHGTIRDTLSARGFYFDQWTREFLDLHKNEDVTILYIACGLDARTHRVQWGSNVRWIDLDLPDVVELRRKLLPEPSGDYTLLAGSALDDSVLSSIPNDRPTAIIIEGLLFYLEEAQALELIRRLCSHFPSGELMFDTMSPAVVSMQKWRRSLSSGFSLGDWMQRQGAGFASGIADPAALEKLHPGLKLQTKIAWTEMERIKHPTMGHRFLQLLAWLPIPALNGYNLRFTF